MYRPSRRTAISGHTRLISGHEKAETYHAICIIPAGNLAELTVFAATPKTEGRIGDFA